MQKTVFILNYIRAHQSMRRLLIKTQNPALELYALSPNFTIIINFIILSLKKRAVFHVTRADLGISKVNKLRRPLIFSSLPLFCHGHW